MTAAQRKTPTQTNGGTDDGIGYTDAVDIEVEYLHKVAPQILTSIGGTGDAITATSDVTSVVPITAYAKGQIFIYPCTNANTTAPVIDVDGVGNISIKDKFAAALQGGELQASGNYILYCDGTHLLALGISAGAASQVKTAPDVIVQDQKTSGTQGGTFTSGSYQQRTLNTLVRNINSLASLSSNLITLPAGTYYARWWAIGFDVNSHKTRLFNFTDNSQIGLGAAMYANNSFGGYNASKGEATFTITSSKAIEIVHQCQSTAPTSGFGQASSFGDVEIYCSISIWKQ